RFISALVLPSPRLQRILDAWEIEGEGSVMNESVASPSHRWMSWAHRFGKAIESKQTQQLPSWGIVVQLNCAEKRQPLRRGARFGAGKRRARAHEDDCQGIVCARAADGCAALRVKAASRGY